MNTALSKLNMRRMAIIVALATGMSCSHERTPADVKAELEACRTQLSEINKKIAELEAEARASGDTIAEKGIKISVTELKTETFCHYFRSGGTAEAVQKAYISPEMGGQIQRIHVEEGQRVSKGDILVSLNAGPIQAQIAELKTALELATTVYNKQKELWDQGIGSEIQFIEAKTSKQSKEQQLNTANVQYAMSMIKAPFDGIVDDIIGKVGEMSSPGMEVVRMVNLGTIEVTAEIAESYLEKIRKGDKVTVYFPSLGSKKIEARIDRIGNIINPANRTFKVVVKIDNASGEIKPNMVAVMEIKDYENTKAIAVPSEVLKSDVNGKTFLYAVQDKDGILTAEKVFVTTGVSYINMTEVVSGLAAGQKIIADGFSTVSPGAVVQIAQD